MFLGGTDTSPQNGFLARGHVRTRVGVRSTGGLLILVHRGGYWPLVLCTPTIVRVSLRRRQSPLRTTVGATLMSCKPTYVRDVSLKFTKLPTYLLQSVVVEYAK